MSTQTPVEAAAAHETPGSRGGGQALVGKRRRYWVGLLRLGSLAGVGLIGWRFHDQIGHAFSGAADVGPAVIVLAPLFALWNAAATAGWWKLLRATPRASTPSFWRLFVVRVEGQAVNLMVPSGGVGGDVLRSALTAADDGQRTSASAVALDKLASVVAEVSSIVIGLLLAGTLLPNPVLAIGSAALAMAMVVAVLLFWQRGCVLLSRWGWVRSRVSAVEVLATSPGLGAATQTALLWHLLERLLMMGEIWLVSTLLGVDLGLRGAFIAKGIASAAGAMLFFVPGQAGAYDGGLAYGFSLLGLPAELGLTVALVRRARQLLVGVAGSGLLLLERGRRTEQEP